MLSTISTASQTESDTDTAVRASCSDRRTWCQSHTQPSGHTPQTTALAQLELVTWAWDGHWTARPPQGVTPLVAGTKTKVRIWGVSPNKLFHIIMNIMFLYSCSDWTVIHFLLSWGGDSPASSQTSILILVWKVTFVNSLECKLTLLGGYLIVPLWPAAWHYWLLFLCFKVQF